LIRRGVGIRKVDGRWGRCWGLLNALAGARRAGFESGTDVVAQSAVGENGETLAGVGSGGLIERHLDVVVGWLRCVVGMNVERLLRGGVYCLSREKLCRSLGYWMKIEGFWGGVVRMSGSGFDLFL